MMLMRRCVLSWTSKVGVLSVTMMMIREACGARPCSEMGIRAFGLEMSNLAGVCSGHGQCGGEDNATCICERGWTGRSDWISTEGYDCQINDVAVKVEWGLCLLFVVTVFIYSFPLMRLRWRTLRENNMSIWKSKALLSLLMYTTVLFPSIVLIGVLRIADSSQRVGVTVPMTLLFILIKIGFYLIVYLFHPSMVAALLRGDRKNRKNLRKLLRLNQEYARFHAFNSIATGMLALVPLISQDGNGSTSRIAWVLYCSMLVFSLAAYGSHSAYTRAKIIRVLDKGEGRTPREMVELKEKIKALYDTAIQQATLHGAIHFCLLVFPFLWNKHDYFLPLVYMGMGLIVREIASTTTTSFESTSGNNTTAANILGYAAEADSTKNFEDEDGVHSSAVDPSTSAYVHDNTENNSRRTSKVHDISLEESTV